VTTPVILATPPGDRDRRSGDQACGIGQASPYGVQPLGGDPLCDQLGLKALDSSGNMSPALSAGRKQAILATL
jgi:hypothetical protein